MACCSSRSWRVSLIFFTVSLVLAFLAISTPLLYSKRRQDSTSPTKPASLELSLNASKALRRAGFNAMATLFQFSPEIFLSSPNATIFAVPDITISNSSLPPGLLKSLLQYHTLSLNLPLKDLLKQPQGTCLPTLLPGRKSIAVTKVLLEDKAVEINGVLISHPDVFLGETISIHGLREPFSSLDPEDIRQGWNSIEAPICDSSSLFVWDTLEDRNVVEWSLVIRRLSSNGFESFAIRLNSVLDGILEEFRGLESLTIFAPQKFLSLSSPSPLLERLVRFHIVPLKMTYQELAAMPVGTLLVTLVSDLRVEVSGTPSLELGQGLSINGVPIVMPNVIVSESFVVHGISESFETLY